MVIKRRPKRSKRNLIEGKPKMIYRNVILLFSVVGIVSLIIASLWTSVPQRKTVKTLGTTMQPTISEENSVYIDESFYKNHPIERGDIVAIRVDYNDTPAIMRVIAIGGDKLEFREGKIWLNGRMLYERYIIPIDYKFSDRDLEVLKIQMNGKNQVPEGMVLALNDNRNKKGDSRKMGFVNENAIIGKVIIE